MKTPSKIFTWSFHLKSTFSDVFQKNIVFEKICFLKIFFLHDEIIFFVRIFFCDQVCICTNPRNHLEHLPCPHDDSEPRLKKIRQIIQIVVTEMSHGVTFYFVQLDHFSKRVFYFWERISRK